MHMDSQEKKVMAKRGLSRGGEKLTVGGRIGTRDRQIHMPGH